MNSVLMLTATTRQAGAESIVRQLSEGLAGEFDIRQTALKDRSGLPAEGQALGYWQILFGNFDLIHTHLFLPGLFMRARRLWDARTLWVHTLHYADYNGQTWPRLRAWLDRRVFAACDAVVAVSLATFKLIEYLPHAHCIPNGVDLRTNEPAEVDNLVVGTVAMLREEKGLADLLRAFAMLRVRVPGARLKIAGTGPLLSTLQKQANDLGLGESVEFCGYVSDLSAFLRSLSIYVQPSISESFGLAVLEAMQFHLPLVAAAVGNLSSLLANGEYGVLVERDGKFAANLADGMERAFVDLDSARTRSSRGLEHWAVRLSTHKMIASYSELYRRLRRPGACLISPIVTHSTGGLQRQLFLQSREMDKQGFRIFVLQRFDPAVLFDAKVRDQWSHVEFLMPPDLSSAWGVRWRGAAFVFGAFLKIFWHRRRIHILHAHQLYSPTLAGAAASWLFGLPLAVKVTAGGVLGEWRELQRLPFARLRRFFFRAVDRVIVLNEEMAAEMRRLFPEDRIRLIPNSVEIPPENNTAAIPGAPFHILYCGRLSTEKSLETLIDAAQELVAKGFDIEVHLVGAADPDRDCTPQLKARAKCLGARIFFHGRQSDVGPFYAKADAFVLPSLSEGLSNALLEAVAHGLVCVASDIAPNRFVINDGVNGMLFRTGDAHDLAARLEILIRDRRLAGGELCRKISEGARRTVRERFSTQVVGFELGNLYRDLLGATGARL